MTNVSLPFGGGERKNVPKKPACCDYFFCRHTGCDTEVDWEETYCDKHAHPFDNTVDRSHKLTVGDIVLCRAWPQDSNIVEHDSYKGSYITSNYLTDYFMSEFEAYDVKLEGKRYIGGVSEMYNKKCQYNLLAGEWTITYDADGRMFMAHKDAGDVKLLYKYTTSETSYMGFLSDNSLSKVTQRSVEYANDVAAESDHSSCDFSDDMWAVYDDESVIIGNGESKVHVFTALNDAGSVTALMLSSGGTELKGTKW